MNTLTRLCFSVLSLTSAFQPISFAEALIEPTEQEKIVERTNGTRLDLNQADSLALTKVLKGIGQKRAEAIVRYREEHGLFKKLEDLLLVKGISKALYDKYHVVWQEVIFLK